jgi:prepilin-type processing-associated H-X9-DG protein
MSLRLLASLLLAIAAASTALAQENLCGQQEHDGIRYAVCRVDLREVKLEVFNLNSAGQPYGSFLALAEGLKTEGRELLFAMNAGMFGEDLKPIGLYVEDGVQAKRLNRRDGYGNFHLKPNGVFFVDEGRLGVMNTDDYAKSGLKPEFATQSGPMLVIDGEIHPKFSDTGQSAKIRNGVGQIDEHTAVFVMSEDAVNFYSFAAFFKNALGSRNALFFDGSVSSLYSPELGRTANYVPLGPMVGALKLK